MKRFLLIAVLMLVAMPAAFAVPTLQLYIDGATYDDATQTWITDANSFDLYILGTGDLNNVTLSMALEGLEETDDPTGSSVAIAGNGIDETLSTWTYGYAPLSNLPTVWNGGNDDLAKHGIYPAWYTEIGLGNFTAEGGIGDVTQGTTWTPLDGYLNNDPSQNNYGWFQSYSVTLSGPAAVHFDLFTLNGNTIDQFAPFSHDAAGGQVPEPATMLLFGIGLAGTGIARRFRKK